MRQGFLGSIAVISASFALLSGCTGSATLTGGGAPGGSGITVTVSPKNAWVEVGGTRAYSASVTGTSVGEVSWSVEPAGAGTISALGLYTAPSVTGTYQIVAESVADKNVRGSTSVTVVPVQPTTPYVLPVDRATLWQPGVTYNGGIPIRSTVCATLAAGDGTTDDSTRIQAAIDDCPTGRVVAFAAGTFVVNNFLLLHNGITLRGAGAGVTRLWKSNGTTAGGGGAQDPQPIVIVGPSRYGGPDDATSSNLTVDGAKGSYSVTVASGAGFAAGQFVLLDEASGAQWMPSNPNGSGQIWAAPDYRVWWQKHNPAQTWDDFGATEFPTTPGSAGQWFSRLDRPTGEVKEIASVSGGTITFTSPLHISYRAGSPHYAQVTRFASDAIHVVGAGIEAMTLDGGGAGTVIFQCAAKSWAKNIEVVNSGGNSVSITSSFRVEVRDSYIHDQAVGHPAAESYLISLNNASAEVLVENSIMIRADKNMVARAAGAGSVFGYNYTDMTYIDYNPAWIEVGLNASHMIGPHHVLFEGNYGSNFDSDNGHGNSIYITVFRNYLRGIRRSGQVNGDGAGTYITIDDIDNPSNGPRRCIGSMGGTYWMSFVGNVLGAPGAMSGWSYEADASGGPSVWSLGWNGDGWYDAQVGATALRDGNWDWVQATQSWHNGPPAVLPDSMYLSAAPAFFGANPWPWVDPVTGTVQTLPAKARYDAGTPNVVP